MLEAVKPKKTKLGIAMRKESMRSETSSQLEADASLLHENENEIDLTVEIEVVSLSVRSFQLIHYFLGAKPWDARQSEEHGKSDLHSRVGA